MNRELRLAQVTALLDEGMTLREVAAELGIAVSSVRNVLNDPDGSKQRARRARYRGICIDCGAATDGSNGYGKASQRCGSCRRVYEGSEEARLAKTIWTRDLILARIREWAEIHGEPPRLGDWGTRPDRYPAEHERFLAADGYWPWFSQVYRQFDSMAAACEAAGFPGYGLPGRPRHRWREVAA